MKRRPEQEAALRDTDVRMFYGATSNPDVEFPDEPYAAEVRREDDEHDADPIPVIVVDTVEPSDLTDWGGAQATVTGENPVMVAGARDNRTRMLVTNLGPDVVYLVRTATGAAFTGAPIPLNAVVEMTTNRDVYATCLTGDTALVGVIQEFVIDDE